MLSNKFYDAHVHTTYSSDGRSSLTDYLELLENTDQRYMMITDHVDFDAYFMGGDCIVDYEAVKSEINKLNKDYSTEVLMGIEMGYRIDTLVRTKDFLASQDFDSIVLSVHENVNGDYYKKEFRAKYGFDELLNVYFDDILSAVTEMDNFDILGHIDYLFRVIDLEAFDITKFRDRISEILSILIKKGKTLEINTASIRYIKTDKYTRYILELYKSLGGEFVSLGSDAHETGFYMNGFEDAVALLKEIGFDSVVCYKNRKMSKITL